MFSKKVTFFNDEEEKNGKMFIRRKSVHQMNQQMNLDVPGGQTQTYTQTTQVAKKELEMLSGDNKDPSSEDSYGANVNQEAEEAKQFMSPQAQQPYSPQKYQ